METTQVNQNMSMRAAAIQQMQQNGGMTITQMMSSGVSFADIILMMLSNTQTASGNNSLSGIGLGNTEQTDQSGLQEQFADILGLMTPELMLQSMQSKDGESVDLSSLLESYNGENTDFSDNVVKADPLQLAGLLDFVRTGSGITMNPDIVENNENLKSISSVQSNQNTAFNPEELLKSGEMEIVSYTPAGSGQGSDALMSDENQDGSDSNNVIDFYRTLKSVKESTGTEKTQKSENTVNFNVDDMHKYAENIDISFDRVSAETSMNKAEFDSVEKQLTDGISENLDKGNGEFTVKLKPEGLGEILVKLVQSNEGKMLLTMVASSEKTADILNKDLSSLQSSLNQHNVEIANNSVETAKSVMPLESTFNQYDERRQDEGNQQQQFRNLKSKVKESSAVDNISYDTTIGIIDNRVLDKALNITI